VLLRDNLKRSTFEAHEALEARLALTDPKLRLGKYVWYLQCLLPFYRALAALFDSLALEGPLAADCDSRVAWLQEDLTYLGERGRGEHAPKRFLPRINTTCELLGVSYVVEGAALGGRALYARLHARWGLEQHTGGSFLFGHGADTGRRWQAFVAALNRIVLDEQEQRRCIAAACQMFTGLTEWFVHNQWNLSDAPGFTGGPRIYSLRNVHECDSPIPSIHHPTPKRSA
jgi:heme oxygenase